MNLLDNIDLDEAMSAIKDEMIREISESLIDDSKKENSNTSELKK